MGSSFPSFASFAFLLFIAFVVLVKKKCIYSKCWYRCFLPQQRKEMLPLFLKVQMDLFCFFEKFTL